MWVVYALLAAVAGAVLAILTKAALRSVDPALGLAVQSVLIVLIAWGTAAVRGSLGQVRQLEGVTWAYLLVGGVVTGTSYLLLFRALKLGDAARVVPVDRLSLVFAILLGATFLKEKVNAQVILGGALMAAGAVLIALAQR